MRTMTDVRGQREMSTPQPAVAVPEHAPAIDPQAIERLRELDPRGEHGMLERVLRAYQSSLVRLLAEMAERGAAEPSLEQLARATHTLKSSSSAVGALPFSQLCADIEHLVRREQRRPSSGDLDALIEEGRRVLEAVTAMLAK